MNLEKNVVIELDGGQHALNPGDRVRDEWLRAEGFKVLRFWDNQVFSNLEGVLETIRNAPLTLTLSLEGRGRGTFDNTLSGVWGDYIWVLSDGNLE